MLCCAATPGSTSRHPSSAVTSASALWYTIARMSSGEWIRKFCGVPTASTGGVFSVNVCVPPCASCWMICGSLIGSHFDGSARSAASGSVLPYTVTRMGRGDRQPTENAVTRAITVDCRRNEKPYSSYLAFGGVTRLASTRLPPSPPPPPPSRRSLSMRCSRPSRSSVTRARSSLSNAASSLASATGCRRYCHTCAVVKPSGRTKIDSREFSVAIRATVPMRHSECVLSRNSTREPCCRPSVWCSFATASLNSASPSLAVQRGLQQRQLGLVGLEGLRHQALHGCVVLLVRDGAQVLRRLQGVHLGRVLRRVAFLACAQEHLQATLACLNHALQTLVVQLRGIKKHEAVAHRAVGGGGRWWRNEVQIL
eukprot:Rhum_TRINITY_DN9894_c0_g2::Rhum_TRINITY_DN9894_c0_g2_i1::g.35732::m.35732